MKQYYLLKALAIEHDLNNLSTTDRMLTATSSYNIQSQKIKIK